ncbi:MAG: BON domain-containing protein [Gemmatimonadales bacterium]
MALAVVRERRVGEVIAWALCGVLAGVAAGFVVSELVGANAHHRLGRLVRYRKPAHHTPRGRLELMAKVLDAIAAEPALSEQAIEVRSRGSRGLELRGWVQSRGARTLAYRLARAASGGVEIANRLLVRGEDDHAERPAPEETPRTA